jgi:large subunit ribosomal protein L29
MAKVSELRDLGDEDLVGRLESSKEELFNLRFQLATGQLDNPMRIKDVRRDVARILTILRERELEIALEADLAPVTQPIEDPGSVALEPEARTRRRRLRREPKESSEQEES